jgi:hypothetical protein
MVTDWVPGWEQYWASNSEQSKGLWLAPRMAPDLDSHSESGWEQSKETDLEQPKAFDWAQRWALDWE